MNLIERYEISNKLSQTWAKISKAIFGFRNGDISYKQLQNIIKEEMKWVMTD